MTTAQSLADAFEQSSASDYVRLVADWLHRVATDANLDLTTPPGLTEVRVVDGLVAAASAHACFTRGLPVPIWTTEPVAADRHVVVPGPGRVDAMGC